MTAPADVGINPVGDTSCNGYILEIVDKTAQRDDYWNVRSVGSDCSGYALQSSRFVFGLAVRQRRAHVKAGVATFVRRGNPVESPPLHRISGTALRSVVAEEASTKARADCNRSSPWRALAIEQPSGERTAARFRVVE